MAVVCKKNPYPNQASARRALDAILHDGEVDGAKFPVRVYPCDVCEGWHLTSKKVFGKVPPWDRDPNWTRSGQVHETKPKPELSRRGRKRTRRGGSTSSVH